MTAQASQPRRQTFPRPALFAAGAVILLTIFVSATARLGGLTWTLPTSVAVTSQDLRFEDRLDGAVAVYRTSDDKLIDMVPPGTNGFLRGALRGIARERKMDNLGSQAPFRLTAWADQRLTLEDMTTHRMIDLEAFGSTNEAVFADILKMARTTP